MKVSQTFGGGSVDGGQIKESDESSSTGSVEEERGDVELCRNIEGYAAEQIHDESSNGETFGDGKESSKDVWFVEAEDFEGEVFVVGRRG